MICAACRTGFSKTEEKRRIEVYLVDKGLPTEREVEYGLNVPAHPLEDAPNVPLVCVYHRKCRFARKAHETVVAARAADPSRSTQEPQDWRPQEVADLEDMISEGHRDYRGA